MEKERPTILQIKKYLWSQQLFAGPAEDLARERLESEVVDRLLGFQIRPIEATLLKEAQKRNPTGDVSTLGRALHQGLQTWVGLNPRVLQTPYSEFWRILGTIPLRPGQVVVDLGAAYGRLGVVLSYVYPEAQFFGYEFVPERVAEGRRVYELYGLSQAKLVHQDVTARDFDLPRAQLYFIYDYGRNDHLKATFERLRQYAQHFSFHLVVKGKVASDLMNSPRYRSMVTSGKENDRHGLYFCRAIDSTR